MSVLLGPSVEPIPGYRLIERLGRGGFGEVWKAEAPGGLHKAIKFVYGDLSSAGESEPAEQERRSLERIKSIRHPYILSLERIEEIDGQLVIVMELADRNLWDQFRDYRAQGQPGVPREELLRYLEETAEALDLMNIQHQLQHLDIKPQNLFLVYNHIKVADFGLVKELRGDISKMTGGVTPVYAAPETFNGFVSQQCDQYSLAIVYQELLTGQRPFNGTNAYQLLSQHVNKPPDVSPLPESDRPVVAKALSKKPEDRFTSCSEFVRALRAIGGGVHRISSNPAVSYGGIQSTIATPNEAFSPTDHDRPSALSKRQPPVLEPPLTLARPLLPGTQPRPNLVPHPLPEPTETVGSEEAGLGSLVPAVVLGVGGVATRVLQQLRSAIHSQITTAPLPHLRLLAIDTDAANLRDLTNHPKEPLGPQEVFHAGLNRPSHYLKSDANGSLVSWLGSHMLHRLPRNPSAAGLRAFGRLALCDHAANLARRLKAELEACRSPTSLATSDQATGLGIRAVRPRVYIVAGLGGGTGGGMFLDLAYLARHVLRQIGDTSPQVFAILLLPHADRANGLSNPAIANSVAALTELNHFCDETTRYEYNWCGKTVAPPDFHRPLYRCCFLPLAETANEAAFAEATGQAGAILFRDLLSPLGRAADREREAYASFDPVKGVDAQTAATYRLAWPYDRLRRRTARGLVVQLLRGWTSSEIAGREPAISEWLESQWESRGLVPERIADRFHQNVAKALGATPNEEIESLLRPDIEAGKAGAAIDGRAACQTLEQIIRLLGPPEGRSSNGKPCQLPELFAQICPEIARQCDQWVAELAIHFFEEPRYRIGGAEEAIRQIGERARQSLTSYDGVTAALNRETEELFKKLLAMIGGLDKFSLIGLRRDAQNEALFALVREYAKKRYQALLSKQLTWVFSGVVNSMTEFLREVNQCRKRLAELEKVMIARFTLESELDPALGPGQHVLDGGVTNLGEAADQLIAALGEGDWEKLDRSVQSRVRKEFRTLVNYCLDTGSNTDVMVALLESAAEEFVAPRLGRHSTVELFLSVFGDEKAAEALQTAIDAAHPPLAGPRARLEAMVTVIAAPETEAGRRFRVQARRACAEEPVATAESAEEILVYRELRRLTLSDLPHFAPPARTAYQQALTDTEQSLHNRCDISWLPVK